MIITEYMENGSLDAFLRVSHPSDSEENAFLRNRHFLSRGVVIGSLLRSMHEVILICVIRRRTMACSR